MEITLRRRRGQGRTAAQPSSEVLVTVARSENNRRQVPMNPLVRPVLIDLAGKRARPNDPVE